MRCKLAIGKKAVQALIFTIEHGLIQPFKVIGKTQGLPETDIGKRLTAGIEYQTLSRNRVVMLKAVTLHLSLPNGGKLVVFHPAVDLFFLMQGKLARLESFKLDFRTTIITILDPVKIITPAIDHQVFAPVSGIAFVANTTSSIYVFNDIRP
ncbi:MAG: hypothetical protein ACD_6C00679G0002 [uncultured bacterium]|nr:MAG: hypothetical protein ACD_6C00679G0002 [uncultured bacterium]